MNRFAVHCAKVAPKCGGPNKSNALNVSVMQKRKQG
jgi:hypothetical protein